MPIVVEQALYLATDQGDPTDNYTFTTDLGGSNPTAGNTLIVCVACIDSLTITSVADNQSNIWVEDANENTDRFNVFRATNISSGVTDIDVVLSATGTPWFFVLEVSGMTNTSPLQDTAAWAADGEGFAVSHGFEYTTLEAGELVICFGKANASRVWTGTGGATAVTSNSTARNVIYEIVSAAETADITWDLDTAQSCTMALVSYKPAAAGGASFSAGPTVEKTSGTGAYITATGTV